MNKLKVSTFRGTINQKHEKILKCLEAYPEGTNPKTIAFHTSINVNTIKSILPKLKDVSKTMRGFYKVDGRGDGANTYPPRTLSDWTFHNCILTTLLPTKPRSLISQTISLGLINLKFMLTTKGKASLRIGSSTPLNISSLSMTFAYFREKLLLHCDKPINSKQVYISTIEFNKDYSNLRLDGVKCITLDSLSEQFKVYQKRLGLRIEHKTKVNFTVENIVDMLTNNPNSLESNIKLTQQGKQIERLSLAMQTTQNLMKRILEVRT